VLPFGASRAREVLYALAVLSDEAGVLSWTGLTQLVATARPTSPAAAAAVAAGTSSGGAFAAAVRARDAAAPPDTVLATYLAGLWRALTAGGTPAAAAGEPGVDFTDVGAALLPFTSSPASEAVTSLISAHDAGRIGGLARPELRKGLKPLLGGLYDLDASWTRVRLARCRVGP